MHTVKSLSAYLTKKHPINYSISTSESNDLVLGYIVYGFVETENEKLMYSTDKAGRVRLVRKDTLNPTYKSVRLQPKDRVIKIVGEGPHKGKFVVRQEPDGWLTTTAERNEAPLYRQYDANSIVSRLSFNAQYCYGGKFEAILVN